MGKWKIETWHKKLWKGTERETIKTYEKLVMRKPNGQIEHSAKIVYRSYGSGYYQVGISKDKVVTRKLIAKRNLQWYEAKKEVMKHKKLYRVQIVLNDANTNQNEIPYKHTYYGFRLIAFHTNHDLLKQNKEKFKDILIKFIEDCIKYKEDNWIWFDAYYGYEGFKNPTLAYGANMNENGYFYLQWTKRHGSIQREEIHRIKEIL